jgi:hypothetical protein
MGSKLNKGVMKEREDNGQESMVESKNREPSEVQRILWGKLLVELAVKMKVVHRKYDS